jgi:hypothetical protein
MLFPPSARATSSSKAAAPKKPRTKSSSTTAVAQSRSRTSLSSTLVSCTAAAATAPTTAGPGTWSFRGLRPRVCLSWLASTRTMAILRTSRVLVGRASRRCARSTRVSTKVAARVARCRLLRTVRGRPAFRLVDWLYVRMVVVPIRARMLQVLLGAGQSFIRRACERFRGGTVDMLKENYMFVFSASVPDLALTSTSFQWFLCNSRLRSW